MENPAPRFYAVEFEPPAWKQIMALPFQTQERIFAAVEALEADPRPSGAKKLEGSELYRVRAGNFRVIYAIEDAALCVLVVKVADRKEAYKRKR